MDVTAIGGLPANAGDRLQHLHQQLACCSLHFVRAPAGLLLLPYGLQASAWLVPQMMSTSWTCAAASGTA